MVTGGSSQSACLRAGGWLFHWLAMARGQLHGEMIDIDDDATCGKNTTVVKLGLLKAQWLMWTLTVCAALVRLDSSESPMFPGSWKLPRVATLSIYFQTFRVSFEYGILTCGPSQLPNAPVQSIPGLKFR